MFIQNFGSLHSINLYLPLTSIAASNLHTEQPGIFDTQQITDPCNSCTRWPPEPLKLVLMRWKPGAMAWTWLSQAHSELLNHPLDNTLPYRHTLRHCPRDVQLENPHQSWSSKSSVWALLNMVLAMEWYLKTHSQRSSFLMKQVLEKKPNQNETIRVLKLQYRCLVYMDVLQ